MVLALVVTYNRKEFLKECITSLKNQSYDALKILIIDNASTDGTYEYIKDLLSEDVLYENTGSNLGGAGGFNYGIKSAMKFNPEYIWIMDDDTIPNKDALEKLINGAKITNNEFGFLSSKVLWKDNSICLMNRQRISEDWLNYSDKIDNNLVKVSSASFVSCFVKSEVIKELGLPIKEFFIWGDDVEFTSRISKKYNSYYVNDSIVIHKCATNHSLGIENAEDNRISRYTYLYRNRFYNMKKSGSLGILKYYAKLFRDIFRVIKVSNKKIYRIKSILIGAINGLFFNPKIEFINEDMM